MERDDTEEVKILQLRLGNALRDLENRRLETEHLQSALLELEPKRAELERALSEMAMLEWRLSAADEKLRNSAAELEATQSTLQGAVAEAERRGREVAAREAEIEVLRAQQPGHAVAAELADRVREVSGRSRASSRRAEDE
jgi:peptidoglycan hydrolase CwlO-like protein